MSQTHAKAQRQPTHLLKNRKMENVPLQNTFSYVREQESPWYTSTKCVVTDVFRAGDCQTSERCFGTGNCELLCSCYQTVPPEGQRKGERVVEGLRRDGESEEHKERI